MHIVRMYRLLFMSVVLLLVGGYIPSVSAYLEDRFFCTVENNTITVSLGTGTTNCFHYMLQLHDVLVTIDNDIANADTYIDDKKDTAYWLSVKADLLLKKTSLADLRNQINIAMVDYEQELFVKVKGIVGYYLMPKRDALVEKLEKSNILLTETKQAGDVANYRFIVRQIELIQHQLIVLDRIRESYSFAELLPPLKIYINRGGLDLDTQQGSIL